MVNLQNELYSVTLDLESVVPKSFSLDAFCSKAKINYVQPTSRTNYLAARNLRTAKLYVWPLDRMIFNDLLVNM